MVKKPQSTHSKQGVSNGWLLDCPLEITDVLIVNMVSEKKPKNHFALDTMHSAQFSTRQNSLTRLRNVTVHVGNNPAEVGQLMSADSLCGTFIGPATLSGGCPLQSAKSWKICHSANEKRRKVSFAMQGSSLV